MAGVTQKSSIAAFPLWCLQKQDGWVQRSETNMKDIGLFIFNTELEVKQGR